jgi:RNA polymerase sigma factor (sigma-70 family)
VTVRAHCDDREIWTEAQTDPTAFGIIFERHSQAVFNFCCWRTQDARLSEDLTSSVFLEAWRRRKSVQISGDCVLPWLLGVANNVCRNTSRALRRHSAALKRLSHQAPEPSFEEAVLGRITALKGVDTLATVWAQLANYEKELILLVFWSGLSYRETADALQIPIGTVRSRVARLRHKLQNSIQVTEVDYKGGRRDVGS